MTRWRLRSLTHCKRVVAPRRRLASIRLGEFRQDFPNRLLNEMKIALTGGIACGKSLASKFLGEFGVETLDADDIVHELVPVEERRRLAAAVFRDQHVRHALEAKLHPIVKARMREWLQETSNAIRVAVVPLLFEVHWNEEFDIICCVTSSREEQIARMVTSRGYSREEAEARMAAQMPIAEKAAQSHYVIENNGTAEALRLQVQAWVEWLKERI